MKNYNIPVEATLDVIGGKWKVVILCHLKEQPLRNSELKRLIPAVSQKVLTEQLRQLEQDGIIERTIYQEVPPRVDYRLTTYGETLVDILNAMCCWGKAHMAQLEGREMS
ncbi:MAG: winged helix-turn-helix transcriptional regulator [Bacilli bacterium]